METMDFPMKHGGCVHSYVSHYQRVLTEIGQSKKKTKWAREPASKTAHSTPFLRNLVVWGATLCTKLTQDLY